MTQQAGGTAAAAGERAALLAWAEQALAALAGDAEALLAVADAAVSRLAGQALADGEAALATSVAGLHRLGRRATAEWHRRLGELDARAAWRALGCRSAPDWLASTLALTGFEARAAADVARVLEELPETAARFAAGEIDVAAVQAAAKAHAELARLAARAAAERAAADAVDEGGGDGADGGNSGHEGGDGENGSAGGAGGDGAAGGAGGDGGGAPDGSADGDRFGGGGDGGDLDEPGLYEELDRLVAAGLGGLNRAQARARLAGWQHGVDARYGVEREQRAWRNRSGRLHVDEGEGVGHARFQLDGTGLATVKAALEPLARRRQAGDERSWAQRLADALVAVCQHALDAPDWLPESAGGRPQVLLVTTQATLAAAAADPAHLDGVGAVSSATARLLACDGAVTEVVVDRAGRPLQLRETGRATLAQRQAVIARDRGCVGCDAPVSHTQLHHIAHRDNHGATVVANLTLLCFGCHRKVHHHDWQVLADGGGYRLVAPWHPDAARGIPQPAHCGRPPPTRWSDHGRLSLARTSA